MSWSNDPDVRREQMRRDNARRRRAKQAWENEFDRSPKGRSVCSTCGGLCGHSSRKRGVQECASCIEERAERRAALIVGMYNDGRPIKDIAAALNTSVNALCVDMDRLRKAGRIGYRYAVENGRRVAA